MVLRKIFPEMNYEYEYDSWLGRDALYDPLQLGLVMLADFVFISRFPWRWVMVQ